jgi:diguanylate cyclase (GGDEF)-like protein
MKILVAEDDPVTRRILEATLLRWGHEVLITADGTEAWEVLRRKDSPPLAILDWMMPGMNGLEICQKIREQGAATPVYIILLTAKSSKENIVQGLEAGANDYLIKPFDLNELRVRVQVGSRMVELQTNLSERVRELEQAVRERERAEAALRNLSLTDELTGLYNRRGFFTFAEHYLNRARRTGEASVMLYADMDGLKQINDTLGHGEGSLALKKVADILRETFRASDIIARIGGDEFSVLATDVPAQEVNTIQARLQENVARYNALGNHTYSISLSLGAVCVDPSSQASIEEMIAKADTAMYEHKRSRKKAP